MHRLRFSFSGLVLSIFSVVLFIWVISACGNASGKAPGQPLASSSSNQMAAILVNVRNKMFRNMEGKGFADVTVSARLGNLQKGHGVSFADIDNDGDQDIHARMGGAFKGDAYESALYLNPGQNTNHWINMKLVGISSNRAAIGGENCADFPRKR